LREIHDFASLSLHLKTDEAILRSVEEPDVGAERRLFGMMQHLLIIAAQGGFPVAAPVRGVVTHDDASDAILQLAAVIDEATQAGRIPPERGVHAAAMLMVVRDYIQPLPSVPTDDDGAGDRVKPDLAELVTMLRQEGEAAGIQG
jgi:hypothetical protein